jgi:hypothetical protein
MSLEMTLLPSTGTPPTRSILSTTSYNPLKDEIILFGGATENYAELLSSLHIFNLKLSRWSTVIPQSSLVPPGIYSSFSFCSSDGKFFLLFGKTEKGISSDVYSFDFNHLSWEIVKLSGDSFKAAVDGASCHFEYNGKTWFAIYGGVNAFGESQDLIL